MYPHKGTAILVGILLLDALFFTVQAQSPILNDNPLRTAIDSAVDQSVLEYLKNEYTNNVAIGICYRGKKTAYNYGKSNLQKADDFYNIGSVAKTFVTTLLAQSVIEKKANLNDDIRRFLPGKYPNLEYRGRPIRLVNLANHTSGLPGSFATFSAVTRDSVKGLSIARQVDFYAMYNEDSMLLDLHHVTLDTLPGTKFRYNSSAMKLLELILERMYGQSYEKLVIGYLREHWRMKDTKPFLSSQDSSRVVQGYDNSGHRQQYLNLRGYYFGPTLNSTLDDMLKYVEANLEQKDESIRLTHQVTFGKATGFALGLGWMIDDADTGERYYYHDGNTKLGYNTLCTFYPADTLGIIIMVNDTVDLGKIGAMENSIKKTLHGHHTP